MKTQIDKKTKVNLEDLRLGISAFTEECQVGILDKKDPTLWKEKKEIHNDFLHAVVTCWKNKSQVVRHEGWEYEITVTAKKITNPKK